MLYTMFAVLRRWVDRMTRQARKDVEAVQSVFGVCLVICFVEVSVPCLSIVSFVRQWVHTPSTLSLLLDNFFISCLPDSATEDDNDRSRCHPGLGDLTIPHKMMVGTYVCDTSKILSNTYTQIEITNPISIYGTVLLNNN